MTNESLIKNTFALSSIATGAILGTSALVIWPICYFEKWQSDLPITFMLLSAFSMLTAGFHYFDCIEQRK